MGICVCLRVACNFIFCAICNSIEHFHYLKLSRYDHKSDVWALGIVLYELMCLKHPFNANNMQGLLQKVKYYQP